MEAGLALGQNKKASIKDIGQGLRARWFKSLAKEVAHTNAGRCAEAHPSFRLAELVAEALTVEAKGVVLKKVVDKEAEAPLGTLDQSEDLDSYVNDLSSVHSQGLSDSTCENLVCNKLNPTRWSAATTWAIRASPTRRGTPA